MKGYWLRILVENVIIKRVFLSAARNLWNNLVVGFFIILKDMLILYAYNSNNIPFIHFNLVSYQDFRIYLPLATIISAV